MRYFVWFLLLVLLILHQDYWQWHRSDLVWGFLPYPLAYHMGISIATAFVWLLVTIFCWPRHAELQEQVEQAKLQGTEESAT